MQGLAEAMVSVYRSSMRIFLPTPAKSHYTFSLRDITRIFQGIVLVPAKRLLDPEKLGRLWAHETYRVFYDRYVCIHVCIIYTSMHPSLYAFLCFTNVRVF